MSDLTHKQTEEWYRVPAEEVLKSFHTGLNGLSLPDVVERQKQHGQNMLPEEKVRSRFFIFISQFSSPLVYILLIAAVVVMVMGDLIDAIAIFIALTINAVVGTFQEGKAQAKLRSLKRFVEGAAIVVREGREESVPDKALVPGDVVVLREGDKVSADLRLVFANNLVIDEAAITGESEPVVKKTEPLTAPHLVSGDQINMAFKGTLVIGGYGKGVVVATGLKTVVGGIAAKLSSIDAEMPLKKDIEAFSRVILIVVVAISFIIFFVGLWRGFPVRQMFSTVVAIAVSAIPEGLPIVVTLILATGVYRMSERNALVKRLQAVEALGQAKIVAVDKTGTITRNQMMVSEVYANGAYFSVGGEGYSPSGEIRREGSVVEPLNHQELLLMARSSLFLANAEVRFSEAKKEWERVSGDPTEAALLVFARKLGFVKETLFAENPMLMEIPFDTKNKFHAALNTVGGTPVLSIVGAPEVILQKTEDVWSDGKVRKLEKKDSEDIAAALRHFSRKGLRVLCVAAHFHGLKKVDPNSLPGLCFLGFVGIEDVIRPEVYKAVEEVTRAGMKVVMITGDHKDTAEAIGRKIGIFHDGDSVLLGSDLDTMPLEHLARSLKNVSVFARVSPEHKLKIIEAYKARGEIIAMTGDGVNDALSLAAADLGVAMGSIGTEVAKEAADIILLDDNFGSIVAAVEEGRAIYKTIQKVLLYLLSTNVCEILIIALALFLGYDVPFTPSQLIWINLVTDSFLVIALALEPREGHLLDKVSRGTKKHLIDLVSTERIILMGAVMTLGTLMFYDAYLSFAPERASTVALTILVVYQCFNVFNCRSRHDSVVTSRVKGFSAVPIAFVATIILQFVSLHIPFLQNILHTVPLYSEDWVLIIAAGLFIIMADELRKIVYRARVRSVRT